MTKYLKYLFIVAVITLFASSAFAGQILKCNDAACTLGAFSTYPSITNSYKTALEIYNPGATNTSVATTVIALRFDATEIPAPGVLPAWTVTFNFTDGDARFATIGPQYIWILYDPVTGLVYAASSLGAVGPIITLTSGNVDLAGQGIGNIPPATALYLAQAVWDDTAGAIPGVVEPATELSGITNPTVVLLNKAADCNTSPTWPLTASIAGFNGNIGFPTVTFTYVTPQFTVTGPAANGLNAELDTDTAFTTFIAGSGPHVVTTTQIDYDTLSAAGFFVVNDSQTTDHWNWIAWTTGVSGAIQFDLISVSAEPGIPAAGITFNGNACTETTADRVWRCNSGTVAPLIGDLDLVLNIDGTTINNPTIWSIDNVTFPATICANIPRRDVGTWYGGLEAIVPFVKHDPTNGYYTTIKIMNRYNRDVAVYAEPFPNSQARLIVPLTQIGTIPANNGVLTITGADLATAFPGVDFAAGVPVKFNLRVPGANWTGEDPYVEGIVVSDRPGMTRSVPIKFRQWRHGEYNE